MKLLTEEPERMAHEKRLLDALARKETWFKVDRWRADAAGNLCVDFRLQLMENKALVGVLVYPPQFPDVPAYVRPANPAFKLPRHQYGGTGVFCLEWGSDNWHSGITGVDLVRSTRTLVWGTFLQGLPMVSPMPSRESDVAGPRRRWGNARFVVTSEVREHLQARFNDRLQPVKVRTSTLGSSWVCYVSAIGDDQADHLKDVPALGLPNCHDHAAWILRVDDEIFARSIETYDALKASAGDAWPQAIPCGETACAFALANSSGDVRAFWFIGGDSPVFMECSVLDSTRDSVARSPSAFQALATMTVAIVGLGSLGSKIALSLARAGVRTFCLLDEDVLGPENLVRNGLTWSAVGHNKVDGVMAEIKLIAPRADVMALTFEVGGQENPVIANFVAGELAKCQLVIDATASSEAFVALAATCKRVKVPMVWAELFGGGIGALMARSRPGLDGDPLAVRKHVLGVMSEMKPVPEHARAKRNGYEVESRGRVLVGSDADVTVLAGHTTQFALDLLCAGPNSEYPVSAYLIGFKKEWEFRQPFDTIPIDCSNAMAPHVERPPLSDEDQKVIAELVAAVKESDAPRNAAS